ncbi:MAG TPA: CheR family methyltransferase [Spirochaetota bacterium]|nr:CheR family methyltransferase [Spirochaetota bacterium]
MNGLIPLSESSVPGWRPLSNAEFARFRDLLYREMGIHLSDEKKSLVAGRLMKRLRHYRLSNYADYLEMAHNTGNDDELRVLLNLLTTNETHFFREADHFAFLSGRVLPARNDGGTFRAWSAACSTGEEAYSIAMVLDNALAGRPWEVLGSDANDDVVRKASRGVYPIESIKDIPEAFRKKYCMRGVRSQEGRLMIDKALQCGIDFRTINLNRALPPIGQFDAVFLRNVMIYFNNATRREVLGRIYPLIKQGGYLMIGHTESLVESEGKYVKEAPSVYRKP